MTDIDVDCVAAVYFHWFDCSEHCVITPYCAGCIDFLVPAAPAGQRNILQFSLDKPTSKARMIRNERI